MEQNLERREKTIALYDSVNCLFERVRQMCGGVFFEILVEPIEPNVEPVKRFIINLVDYEEDLQDKGYLNADGVSPVLQERFIRIERLQDNYKMLLELAVDTWRKLREDFDESLYKVTLIRRKEHPNPEVDPEIDSGEEEYTDSESDWESEADGDWESDLDSGLNSETDSQSELDMDTDMESDPDSGMD